MKKTTNTLLLRSVILIPACILLFAFTSALLLKMNAASKIIDFKNGRALQNDIITCKLSKNVSGAEFHFFAKNNLSAHVFELTDNNFQPLKIPANKNLFSARFNQLFYKEAQPGNSDIYTWGWKARAEPPVSPAASIKGMKVKKITCWFTVATKGKTYKSNVITLQVK